MEATKIMATNRNMATNSNLKNAIVAFLVPLPSILLYLSFQSAISGYSQSPSSWSTLWTWCYHHPLLFANVLFFFNVNLLFWLIGLIQSSHWVHFPLNFPFFFCSLRCIYFRFWFGFELDTRFVCWYR